MAASANSARSDRRLCRLARRGIAWRLWFWPVERVGIVCSAHNNHRCGIWTARCMVAAEGHADRCAAVHGRHLRLPGPRCGALLDTSEAMRLQKKPDVLVLAKAISSLRLRRSLRSRGVCQASNPAPERGPLVTQSAVPRFIAQLALLQRDARALLLLACGATRVRWESSRRSMAARRWRGDTCQTPRRPGWPR